MRKESGRQRGKKGGREEGRELEREKSEVGRKGSDGD